MTDVSQDVAERELLRAEIARIASELETIEPLRSAYRLLLEAGERAALAELPPGRKKLTEEEFERKLLDGIRASDEGRTVSLEEAVARAQRKLGMR